MKRILAPLQSEHHRCLRISHGQPALECLGLIAQPGFIVLVYELPTENWAELFNPVQPTLLEITHVHL